MVCIDFAGSMSSVWIAWRVGQRIARVEPQEVIAKSKRSATSGEEEEQRSRHDGQTHRDPFQMSTISSPVPRPWAWPPALDTPQTSPHQAIITIDLRHACIHFHALTI